MEDVHSYHGDDDDQHYRHGQVVVVDAIGPVVDKEQEKIERIWQNFRRFNQSVRFYNNNNNDDDDDGGIFSLDRTLVNNAMRRLPPGAMISFECLMDLYAQSEAMRARERYNAKDPAHRRRYSLPVPFLQPAPRPRGVKRSQSI